jgi:YidC/Oxa1 family membrane protein insertase
MLLSLVVLMGWPLAAHYLFPQPPVAEPVASIQPAPPQPDSNGVAQPAAPTAQAPTAAKVTQAQVTQAQVAQAPLREPITIVTPYWRATLSNHGAVATSWILTHYKKDGALRPIRAADNNDLQLIPQDIPQDKVDLIGLPLALRSPGSPQLASQLNQSNFHVEGIGADEKEITLADGDAPREITFISTVGTTTARKTFKFYADRMVFDATADLTTNGAQQPVELVIGPRIGDQSDRQTGSYATPPHVVAYTKDGSREQVLGSHITQPVANIKSIDTAGNQITLDKPLAGNVRQIKIVDAKSSTFVAAAQVAEVIGDGHTLKLEQLPAAIAPGQGVAPEADTLAHDYSWAGVSDHYFSMLAVPPQPVGEITLTNLTLPAPAADQPAHEYPAVAIPVYPTSPTRIFIGPKDRDLLEEVGRALNAKLDAVIDYGFFGRIIRPLIPVLAWSLNTFNKIFHNYGWAIVATTVLLNLFLFPLRYTSSKKMKKAAKHQPRMKELQDRMKKLKENPKKYERELQELQQEQLALMKEANPLGGCLPLLLQMPIFWAVYMYLGMSLDVRHEPWILWIDDLSRPDRLGILPIVMCVTMIASTMITPQPASADPSMKMQRIMMTWLMPIMLTWFFFFSAPSGLVLYWMVSNIVGVAMQYVINKWTAEPTNEPGALTAGSGGTTASPRIASKPSVEKAAKGKGSKRSRERRGGAEAEGF